MNDDILILGGGHQGLAMAAHLALHGETVRLWNRTPEHIAEVMKDKSIRASGFVQGEAQIGQAGSELGPMMTRRIMIATTAAAHKPLARQLASLLPRDSIVILNPGRTFGAEEFRQELLTAGCEHMPTIAETQTIVYTCRRDSKNSVYIYGLKKDVGIAVPDGQDINKALAALPACLKPYFTPVKSTILTSLGNVGMILHCAPVLMNIGWIEHPTVEFTYYYDGISKSIAAFLEKLDAERLSTAKCMGYPVESVTDWLRRVYLVTGDSLFECLRNNLCYRTIEAPDSLHHRYIEDDVPYGLVPLESAAKHHGVQTPLTSMLIDLANTVMNSDYRAYGRTYHPVNA